MNTLVQQTFTATLPSLELLRTLVVAALSGVDGQIVSDVELIATELVTNAHLHGRPPIQFRLYYADPATLRMDVTDSAAALPRVMHPDSEAEHGRGLLLVQAMSTTWGVLKVGTGKTVWAEFVLSSGQASSDAVCQGQSTR
ncbi:MAG TPA: ATP-binding protein [Pseudonocardiaceae bacterium]|nr:ATP-binding protein [Pseudonocardiaceae bacterium]